MNINYWKVLPFLSVLLAGGCATNEEIYYWGEYEQLIYDSYINPGTADTLTQIEKLNSDLQEAEALGKKVAPGIYAHLALLYAADGKDSHSKQALNQEKALYPESKIFIDGMFIRAAKNNKEKQL
ncbi:MAG: DUF4810 domain-containing protein [Candidatus Ruthia sp.]|jgi:hypothetical protein|nr:DUF4810 domain-containing protein [Candidatus Neomarinimicrobiota bacterium]MBT4123456.1 DUF4810 domain-containing protein [Candidatus Ruthturnera sp.]MBT4669214.1 DUF4810 domain-containing protein [Candidatus Ruthturnera sp.]MBT4994764.1 DUF4810 domain-containing protein [Candidatus Neomarinimicrobiota bacterium]MBT6756823.1 DUF4810 domain-containing protein [Candidatus Jacksonbacteria bacterium]